MQQRLDAGRQRTLLALTPAAVGTEDVGEALVERKHGIVIKKLLLALVAALHLLVLVVIRPVGARDAHSTGLKRGKELVLERLVNLDVLLVGRVGILLVIVLAVILGGRCLRLVLLLALLRVGRALGALLLLLVLERLVLGRDNVPQELDGLKPDLLGETLEDDRARERLDERTRAAQQRKQDIHDDGRRLGLLVLVVLVDLIRARPVALERRHKRLDGVDRALEHVARLVGALVPRDEPDALDERARSGLDACERLVVLLAGHKRRMKRLEACVERLALTLVLLVIVVLVVGSTREVLGVGGEVVEQCERAREPCGAAERGGRGEEGSEDREEAGAGGLAVRRRERGRGDVRALRVRKKDISRLMWRRRESPDAQHPCSPPS